MTHFIVTVGNDAIGWTDYDVDAIDMDSALMGSGALMELVDIDEGTITLKIGATDA